MEGRAYNEILKAKHNDITMGRLSRIVEVRVNGRHERGTAGVPTSSGKISEKTRRARREGGKEIRNALFNDAAQRHHELFNNPFGSGCSCKQTNMQRKSELPGESCGAASDSGGRPQIQAEKLSSFGPIQVMSVGGGGSAEPPFTFVGSSNAPESPLERSSPVMSDSVILSNGSSTSGSMQQPSDDMPLDDSNRTVGSKSDIATARSNAEVLACRVIDNMPALVQAEFANAAFKASVVSNAQFEKIKLTLNDMKPSSPSKSRLNRRRPARTRGSPQSRGTGGSRKAKAGKSKTAARPETTDTRPENTCVLLSEENKEHLKIITAALISDLLPEMLTLAADDPRIQKLNLGSSKRFKERIIKEYRAELRAKRKSEVSLLITAMRLSKNAVSSQAYATVRGILVSMGHRDVLPTVKDVREAGKHLMKCATEDLKIHSTPDGWFVSPRALLEMEILRSLQMTSANASRSESGARLIGHSGPGMHGWQDHYQVKFTLDARTITKRTSHTELMMQVFKKGKQGQAESQKSLCMRTVGIFMGKDSRENVQANLTGFNKECQDLAEHGVIFNMVGQTFLGQSEAFRNLSAEARIAEEDADPAEKVFHPVKIGFWVPADMAAQCAFIGHGCGGHHYCAHCLAHEEERHLPYRLITVDEDISFQALAKKHDMHARTLYAINAAKDHKGVQRLTREGLCNSTAMDPEAREQAREQERETAPEQDGGRRPGKKAKVVPVAKVEPDSLMLGGTLVGWKSNHPLHCCCDECKIPKGTCVRVIPNVGFSRPSKYLSENFPFLTAARMPFCALHCLMRVTEGMFYQICQAVLTSKDRPKLVTRMNAALKAEKINRQFQQNIETAKWEKVSFEGHQAKALLTAGEDGKMAIERILYAIWPGATEDRDVGAKYGTQFVPRTLEVWRQWAVVEELMSERFSDVLLEKMVDGLNGYERFGMECREFIFRFQAMSTEDYSKSYYLHTLLHHAGDFMRELKKEGMTLGMMSNSGAERRHEYGRRASRKALASNGWRKKCPEYDKMPNLLVYITLKEITSWDYGEDLISHELARLSTKGELPCSGPLPKGSGVVFNTKSRRALLSEEEAREEHEAGPLDPPPDFETRDKAVWGLRGKKKTHAIFEVEPDTVSAEEGNSEGFKYNPDNENGLFSGVPVYASDDDESDAGSEEDFEFETINDGEFPDVDDKNDREFQAGGKGGTMAVRGERGGYPFRETTVIATVVSLAKAAAAAAAEEAESGSGFTCVGTENANATAEAMPVGVVRLAPAAVSRGEFVGARSAPSLAAALRVGGEEARGGRRHVAACCNRRGRP